MSDCIFCAIIDNQAPGSVLYEDDYCVVFMDIAPVNAGHALVVPRAHAAGLADLSEEIGMHLFRIAQRTAAAIRRTEIPCQGSICFLPMARPPSRMSFTFICTSFRALRATSSRSARTGASVHRAGSWMRWQPQFLMPTTVSGRPKSDLGVCERQYLRAFQCQNVTIFDPS